MFTNVNKTHLYNYETGKTNPDSYSIIKLADFFGVSTDYLLGYSDINIKTVKDIYNALNNIEKEIAEIKRVFSVK